MKAGKANAHSKTLPKMKIKIEAAEDTSVLFIKKNKSTIHGLKGAWNVLRMCVLVKLAPPPSEEHLGFKLCGLWQEMTAIT